MPASERPRGADLIIGKALGGDGYRTQSQVFNDTEWAASDGAKVVNMSLGANIESDGTGPMSLALDEPSRSNGACSSSRLATPASWAHRPSAHPVSRTPR